MTEPTSKFSSGCLCGRALEDCGDCTPDRVRERPVLPPQLTAGVPSETSVPILMHVPLAVADMIRQATEKNGPDEGRFIIENVRLNWDKQGTASHFSLDLTTVARRREKLMKAERTKKRGKK